MVVVGVFVAAFVFGVTFFATGAAAVVADAAASGAHVMHALLRGDQALTSAGEDTLQASSSAPRLSQPLKDHAKQVALQCSIVAYCVSWCIGRKAFKLLAPRAATTKQRARVR